MISPRLHAAEAILARRNLPLIFLSSHTEPEVVAKTEKITSYGYIVKNSGDQVLPDSCHNPLRSWPHSERGDALQGTLRVELYNTLCPSGILPILHCKTSTKLLTEHFYKGQSQA